MLVCVFMNVPRASPRIVGRIAGGFYVLTFVAGITAMLLRSGLGVAAGVIAAGAYVVVTVLFYWIFQPVNRRLSVLAAIISLAGCAIGPLSFLHVLPIRIHPLVFFGLYCTLIGYLVWKSTFLPRVLAVLMMCAGLGWLTFASTSLTRMLSPYNLIPGIVGEGALTLWLVIVGINERRWTQRRLSCS